MRRKSMLVAHWNADHILNLLSFQLTLSASAAPIQAWLGRQDVKVALQEELTRTAGLSTRVEAREALYAWLGEQRSSIAGAFDGEQLWGFLSPLLRQEEKDLPSHDDLMALNKPLQSTTQSLLGDDSVAQVPSFSASSVLLAPDKQGAAATGGGGFEWDGGAKQYSAWEGVLGGAGGTTPQVAPPSMSLFEDMVGDDLLNAQQNAGAPSLMDGVSSSPLLDAPSDPIPPLPPLTSSAATPAPSSRLPKPSDEERHPIPSPEGAFLVPPPTPLPPGASSLTQDAMDAALTDPSTFFNPEELTGLALAKPNVTPEPPSAIEPIAEVPPTAKEALKPRNRSSIGKQTEWEFETAFEQAFDENLSANGLASATRQVSPSPPLVASASAPGFQTADAPPTAPPGGPFEAPLVLTELELDVDGDVGMPVLSGAAMGPPSRSSMESLAAAEAAEAVAVSASEADLDAVSQKRSAHELAVVVGAQVVEEGQGIEKESAASELRIDELDSPLAAPLMLNKQALSGLRQPSSGPGYMRKPTSSTQAQPEPKSKSKSNVKRVPMSNLRMQDSGLVMLSEELLASMDKRQQGPSQFARIALILLAVLGLIGGAFGIYLYLR